MQMNPEDYSWMNEAKFQIPRPTPPQRFRLWPIFWIIAGLTIVCCALAGAGWIW